VNPSTAKPTNITLSANTVTAYQVPGITIGTLSTTDPNVNQSYTYQVLTFGNLFAVTGNTLKTDAILTVKTQTTYDVQIQVTDSLGLSFIKTLQVTVNPTVAGPTNITLSNAMVDANLPIGTP